jgi:hypothetical protein
MMDDQNEPRPVPTFHEFAADVYARKLAHGRIRSSAGKAKWEKALEQHLIPALGDRFIDQLEPADIEAWRKTMAAKIEANEVQPATVNSVFSVLRQVIDEATDAFGRGDPMQGIDSFPASDELDEPNALSREEFHRFMTCLKNLHPRAFELSPFRADYEAMEAEVTGGPRSPTDG